MFGRLSTWFRSIPLATQVIAALSVALAPVGVIALIAAARNYAAYSPAHPQLDPIAAVGIALPALMWIGAVTIASLSLGRLVIAPLRAMRIVVERYGAGDLSVRMRDARPGSPELCDLSAAFDTMADRVASHAQAMDAALATQRALTREVHHRVKNNLQIVSSLLSLQARDATSPEAAEAYALIRQRVNALALVHRWMYHNDEAKGVELRPLLSDLSANLEHGFDGRAGGAGRVTCVCDRIMVGQDTALPIAFLVTELIAGSRRAGHADDARAEARTEAASAHLTITSSGFAGEDGFDGFDEGARRIVLGLARQLRNPLAYDSEAHTFRIAFPALTE